MTGIEYKQAADWFLKRTDRHIALVQKYCGKIYDLNSTEFSEIRKKGDRHDLSKFENPEKEPYIYISWEYKLKGEGKKLEVSEDIRNSMNEATYHHIKSNSHHPEYHDFNTSLKSINRDKRDEPSGNIVDATRMPPLDIAEMVADWCSMASEKNNTPKDWADKNINIRWKFDDSQKDLIYVLIDGIWQD